MEKSASQHLKLGLFVILGTALFVAGAYYIGERQSMFGNSSVLYAVFSNTNGLREGNNVRYSGINVGTVKEITMLEDTVIVVRMSVKSDIMTHIRKDAHAVVNADGLVGNMIINILPGTSAPNTVVSGDTLKSFSRMRTEEMLNTLSITNENAALLTAELLKITRDIASGKGVVGALIKDTVMTEDVSNILSNLRTATRDASLAVKNANQLIASLNSKNNVIGVVRDTLTARKVRRMVDGLDRSITGIEQVVKDLDKAVLNADGTISEIRNGQGTLDKLVHDTSLYHNIDRTVLDADATMQQIHDAGIRLNEALEALRHHWLLKGAFKKMDKEKGKNK